MTSEEQSRTTVGAGRLAALYARAPDHTDRERTGVEEQLETCRRLAADLGYTVSDEVTLRDTGPGTTMARPGLTKLLGLLADGRAAAVIVHRLDRLARPESDLLAAFQKQLRRRGVPLYVAKTPKGYYYDPATGALLHDSAVVAAANREDARPPEYIVIPREDERD